MPLLSLKTPGPKNLQKASSIAKREMIEMPKTKGILAPNIKLTSIAFCRAHAPLLAVAQAHDTGLVFGGNHEEPSVDLRNSKRANAPQGSPQKSQEAHPWPREAPAS